MASNTSLVLLLVGVMGFLQLASVSNKRISAGQTIQFLGLPNPPNNGNVMYVTVVGADFFRWAATIGGPEQGAITFDFWDSWLEQGGEAPVA